MIRFFSTLFLWIGLLSTVHAEYAMQGQAQEFQLQVQGVTRWTTVYQPPGLQPNAPTVLLLHGGQQSMRKIFGAQAGGMREWLALADREKFLLLIPNATNAKNGDAQGDRQNWNDLRPADATDKAHADDVGFLMQLLDWAQSKYHYDPRRVYVTGASNGGMMTMRLLIERPERFAAAAAFIASLPASAPTKPSGKRVPLLLLNGTRDPLIQWQGGMIRGDRGQTMPIETMLQWWREVNGVDQSTAQIETLPDRDPGDGCRVVRNSWPAASKAAAPVMFYRIEGGGHSIPSYAHDLHVGPILRRLIGPTCRDVEGADLAWEFFQRFPAK